MGWTFWFSKNNGNIVGKVLDTRYRRKDSLLLETVINMLKYFTVLH